MSQVFGTPRRPAYMVTRTDQQGRPISLDLRPPEGNSVLFTGSPGMGKSLELDRAQQLARQNDWTCVRVDASPREPLENRFVRAVSEDLGGLRKRHGYFSLRKLKKTLRDLTQRSRSQQNGAELRFGVAPVQAVVKKQWEAPGKDGVGSTLNELADNLGELAAKKGQPVMLMVDNLDVASERDLAALTELSAHLERNGQPVYLVGAGGEMAATRLMTASGGMSGIATGVAGRFDVRECRPLADDQLRPAVTEPLRQAGIPYQPDAVENLLKAANGNPSRLRDLADNAVQLAHPPYGVTADVAKLATNQVNARSRVFYQAAWNTCSDAEKDLLAKVAVRGPRGLAMSGETQAAGPGKWQALDTARQGLVARGMLRDNGQRVSLADPGLQDWVQTRVGQSAAHAGVALPGSPAPAITPPGSGRHRQTTNNTTRQVGNTTFTVNR
ncbi:hypothetical protein GCM10009789_16100 [Kribbella sancticallisti]|uniref:Orc1-like AAA ATPase domain-containing protein n=1 Tax=Kribbella sancticallisti TaxID=460087 RepID=A0ABN2CUZ1_9ACTN